MKRHIPNLLTLLNLTAGCIGIIFVFEGNLIFAAYSIWLAALFDFLDGFTARILGVTSAIGKELDSLADMVTFGLLPAFMMMRLAIDTPVAFLQYIPLLIALFAALRLAKFNIDESQATSFVGIPTPAIAFFVSGLPYWIKEYPAYFDWWMIIGLSVILAFTMVIPVRMLALKFKNYSLIDNWQRFTLILVGAILLLVIGPKSFPITITLYLVFSLITGKEKTIS